jgi:hypothetical protein
VLFVDRLIEDTPENYVAQENLVHALEGTDYRCYTAVLERAYHNAVIVSYQVTEFPTLLILDSAAQVLYRETNVRRMNEESLRALLQTIDYYHTTDL